MAYMPQKDDYGKYQENKINCELALMHINWYICRRNLKKQIS